MCSAIFNNIKQIAQSTVSFLGATVHVMTPFAVSIVAKDIIQKYAPRTPPHPELWLDLTIGTGITITGWRLLTLCGQQHPPEQDHKNSTAFKALKAVGKVTGVCLMALGGLCVGWTIMKIPAVIRELQPSPSPRRGSLITAGIREPQPSPSPRWKVPSPLIAEGAGPCNGRPIFTSLQKHNKTPSVTFKEAFLNEFNMSGGICSATAFNLANRIHDQCLQKGPSSVSPGIIPCVENVAAQDADVKQLRSIQTAFNSITVDPALTQTPLQDKIAAMASYYGLKVEQSIPLENIDTAPPGTYLLRAIRPADNHKGELFGHSVVVVKTSDQQGCYFDYNHGLDTTSLEDIKHRAHSMMQRWRLEKPLLHLLTKQKDDHPIALAAETESQAEPPANPASGLYTNFSLETVIRRGIEAVIIRAAPTKTASSHDTDLPTKPASYGAKSPNEEVKIATVDHSLQKMKAG